MTTKTSIYSGDVHRQSEHVDKAMRTGAKRSSLEEQKLLRNITVDVVKRLNIRI